MQGDLQGTTGSNKDITIEEPYLWGHIVELSVRVLFCFSYFWLLASIIIYNLLGSIRMRYLRDTDIKNFCVSQQEVLVKMINKVEIKGFIVTLIIYVVYGVLYAYAVKKLSTDNFLYRLLKIR